MHRLPIAATALVLLAPAPAFAAAPTATTGGVARVTPSSATLTGTVDPNGRETTYSFEYGTTRALGTATPPTSAGRGADPRPAVADLTGLAPEQRIFYRLVARNADGTARGTIRAFRTAPEPTGLTLASTPPVVTFGGSAALAGRLAGTDNAGQVVVLEQRPFPFSDAPASGGQQVTTDATGAFAFPPVPLSLTTQLRAFAPSKGVRSPILTVPVALKVSTDRSASRVRRGARLKFFGSVRPARPGAQVGLQKRTRDGRWVTVAGVFARGSREGRSTYRKTIRPPRGGTYRVFVATSGGDLVGAAGREIKISTFR